jgi:hypothetical protein
MSEKILHSQGANTRLTPLMMFSSSPASRKPVLSLKVISEMTSAEQYPSHCIKSTTPSGPLFADKPTVHLSRNSAMVLSTHSSYLIIWVSEEAESMSRQSVMPLLISSGEQVLDDNTLSRHRNSAIHSEYEASAAMSSHTIANFNDHIRDNKATMPSEKSLSAHRYYE